MRTDSYSLVTRTTKHTLIEPKIMGEKAVFWILTNFKLHMNCSSWTVTVIK
jgi:hypothetical protein